MIKRFTSSALLMTMLFSPTILRAQQEVVISQYIHNQYAINPAFAGSRNCLSGFGAYKKQWVGVEKAPTKQLLTIHAPMENDKMALGLSISNNTIAIFQNTQITGAYAYRVKATKNTQLAFGLDAGFNLYNAKWQEITTITNNDPLFASNGSSVNLALGAGLAWYGNKFFTSLSAPSLLFYNPTLNGKGEFNPTKINYLLSGGYLFKASSTLDLQPSTLIRVNPTSGTMIDAGATAIYSNIIWATIAYRSTGEMLAMAAIQPIPSLKIGYGYDYAMGNLAKFSSGSHEISIQYDFGYKIKSSNPKFF